MGWRVYWTIVIFRTLKKIMRQQEIFSYCSEKKSFEKMESKVYYSHEKITSLLNFRIVTQT